MLQNSPLLREGDSLNPLIKSFILPKKKALLGKVNTCVPDQRRNGQLSPSWAGHGGHQNKSLYFTDKETEAQGAWLVTGRTQTNVRTKAVAPVA